MALDFITRVDPGGIFIDVTRPAYGAVGDGTTDNATAIHAAIAAAIAIGAVVYFPPGVFASTELTYTGTAASAIIFQGSGMPRGVASGTTIKYIGAAGGTLLTWKGANNSIIRDISLDGNGLALKTVVIDYDSVGGVGSSGVSLQNVFITGATGAGSIDLTLGTSTTQASEVRMYNLSLQGYGSPPTAERGIKTSSSNAKNFLVAGVSISNYSVAGVDWGGSGSLTLVQPVFAANVLDIKRTVSTSPLTIFGGQSEQGNKLLTGTSSGNPGSVNIIGFQWQGSTASDDYVISDGANIVLNNCDFYNDRTGSSVPKMQILAGLSSPGMLISEGCTYQHATDHTPVFDSSNNDIFTTYYLSNSNQWRVRSFGDIGGNPGTSWPKLRSWILDADMPVILGGVMLKTETFSATPTFDFSKGNTHEITLTANVSSFTMTGLVPGREYVIRITQGGIGSFTFAWGGNVKWVGGTSPVLSTAAGSIDVFRFVSPNGSTLEEVSRALDVR